MTVFFRRKRDHESKELAIWSHCYRPEWITVSQSGDLRISMPTIGPCWLKVLDRDSRAILLNG
jgi:hypothetical protein